jgi:hypothetical protein
MRVMVVCAVGKARRYLKIRWNERMLHTFAHVTKKIAMDTGTIPDTPPPGTVKSGLLYYKDPGPDYNVVAGVAWEKCKPGMTDTLTRCEDVCVWKRNRSVESLKNQSKSLTNR